MNFRASAEALNDYIVAARRHLHKNAELSMKEYETTAFLVKELQMMGIEVQAFEDYTGCIATIRGGKPGSGTVLLRADIDALPIQENSGETFSSVNDGVMHACGHDAHTAMLLGAAKLLADKREELSGTVKLLFQAGEEVFIGSHYYWDKGYLEDCDAAMGMHVWPTVPAGKMAVKDGYLMASCDNFVLTVHGKAAHGSTPQKSCDAIVAASALILNIQGIVSRLNDPLSPLVVTIGMVHGGTQFNIITDTVVMEGTVRTYQPESRFMVEGAIRKAMDGVLSMYGCTAEMDYQYIEPVVDNNDIALNDIARGAARTLYGDEVLADTAVATGSEDFSYIMEKIPSSLFVFLGCYDAESGCTIPVHNEKFRIPEKILPIGAAEYAQFAADYLEKHAGEGEQ